MKILAFETSCDETSVAVVEDGTKVLSNIISSQIDIHKEYGGVVPEIASRHHIENIMPVFEEALEKAGCKLEDIDYIAVTNTPGLIGSLLVGLMFAKSLSYANNIPLIPVNHIDGHIFSNFIENEVSLPAASLIVSGGHTNLYYIYEQGEDIREEVGQNEGGKKGDENENGKHKNGNNRKLEIELLGETTDDAVGETYDKVARVLGLPYPGGPEIDRISVNGEDTLKIKIPNVDNYNFSFSGIKTFITNYVNNEKMKGNEIIKENVAKSLQRVVCDVLYGKVVKLIEERNIRTVLVAGGVSANKALREKFESLKTEKNVEVHFPKMEYCTDNAAMIGCAAYYKLKNEGRLNMEEALSDKADKEVTGKAGAESERRKDCIRNHSKGYSEAYSVDAVSTKTKNRARQ